MSNALITGASQGFGRALAAALASSGWELVVDARGAARLREATATLTSAHLTAIPGDLTDPDHRGRLAEATSGRLDLLVLNASTLGPSPLPPLAELTLDDLRATLEVNLVGQLALVQTLLPALHAARGTIIGLTSDAAVEPYPGWGGYGASKAALDQLLAILGAEEDALTVYAFDPGDMRTAMHQAAFPGEDISDRPLPETAVPALLRLLTLRPESGRYTAADLAQEASR
ncbi:MAG: SDR family NAD(P)-dependent oxidoreductase [Candidatus Dormiibacterota bacterium]